MKDNLNICSNNIRMVTKKEIIDIINKTYPGVDGKIACIAMIESSMYDEHGKIINRNAKQSVTFNDDLVL